MKNLIYFLLLTFGIGILSSCEETTGLSPNEVDENPIDIDFAIANWDETVEVVALDVSEKLNNPAFRRMLKHEVMLRFDGDYNILISSMMQRMPKYLEYEANQAQVMNTTNQDLLASYDWGVLEAEAEEYPMMQIAVQVDAESWDVDNEILSVVYVPSDFDEATHNSIDGFDKDQKPITVSTLEDPAENYVVISQNERTYELNETVYFSNTRIRVPCCIESAPYDPYEPAVDYFAELCRDCSDDPTPPDDDDDEPQLPPQYIGTGHDGQLPSLLATFQSTLTNSSSSTNRILDPLGEINGDLFYRGNNEYERVREIRLNDINDIEKWLNGAPEIRLIEFTQNQLDPSELLQIYIGQLKPDKRRDINDKWWECDPLLEFHLWQWDVTGTNFTAGMYEYDSTIGNSEDRHNLSPTQTTIVEDLVINSDGTFSITGTRTYTTDGMYLSMKNHKSEYMGVDAISVFNDQGKLSHDRGDTEYKIWADE